MKLNITSKISFFIILVVLITSISSSLFFLDYYQKDEMRHIKDLVSNIARLRAAHFAQNIAKKEFDIIHQEIVSDIKTLINIIAMKVYTRHEHLIVDRNGLRHILPTDKWIDECVQSGVELNKWSSNSFRHFEPILNRNGEILGFLYIEYDTSFLREYIENRRIYYASRASFLVGLFILIGIIISRKLFIKPLLAITEASRRVANGDLSVSVKTESGDEFGHLAENFNSMVERLNAANSELSNYAKNLEYVVELRTERLNLILKELQQQKDFTDKLMATAGALIIVLDEQGRIIVFNKKSSEVTGFTESEVKGRFIWDVLASPVDIPQTRMMFDELISYKLPNSLENQWLTKDGREITVLWNNTVITGEDNEVQWVIGTGVDITEKKTLEKQLQESQKLQAVGTLATGLSHNFNNILVGVMGYSGLLRLKLSAMDHPEIKEILGYVDIIENSTKKASDLIKQLRTFSTRATHEKMEISLNEAINDVILAITATFPRSIAIEIVLSEDVWKINADKNQIQQVVLNICLNAKEAMPEGGKLKIETFNEDIKDSDMPLQKTGKYAVIRISDTGQGMDEETKSRIFEPFFTTKGLLDHTGLGLSIAYSIIRNHNGYIKVSSAPGGPTTFTILLPIA